MNNYSNIKNEIENYYVRYGPLVLRRCRMFFPCEEEAMDAMQEVFIKLIKNKNRLNGPYLSNFLFKIATNVCLNKIRSHRTYHSIDDVDLITKIASYNENEEKFIFESILDYIFRREKKSTREIAIMHFVEGFTLKEVATEVGLSIAGVRKRLKKLRERVLALEVFNDYKKS